MKRNFIIILLLVLVLALPNLLKSESIKTSWYTFLGGNLKDWGSSIAVSPSGDIYITGTTKSGWDIVKYGNPIQSFNNEEDIVVAKFDSSGDLKWYTFLGGNSDDSGSSIALSSSGDIYITGSSYSSWNTQKYGNPIQTHNKEEQWDIDIVIAKLSGSGNLIWYTFLGGSEPQIGDSINISNSEEIYISGASNPPWNTLKYGSPITESDISTDIFVAKLNSSGQLIWYTFMGSYGAEFASSLSISHSGEIYITGNGTGSQDWDQSKFGQPIYNSHDEFSSSFIVKLNSNGILQWYSLLGAWGDGGGPDLIASPSDGIYLTGATKAPWNTSEYGVPLKNFNGATGNKNIYVTKMDSSGMIHWYTYLGGINNTLSNSIDISSKEELFITGHGYGPWNILKYGSPINNYKNSADIITLSLDRNGSLKWYTFLGGNGDDRGKSINILDSENIFLTGYNDSKWDESEFGKPLKNFNGDSDIFIAKLSDGYKIKVIIEGEGGSVDDKSHQVGNGEDVKIKIFPDTGYEIDKIIDNRVEMEVSNPYIIYNVREDHEVFITFGKIKYPPVLSLTGERKTERSWIITKDFAELNISITEHETDPMEVSKYVLYKSISGIWAESASYNTAGSFTFIDKYINKSEKSSYKLTALSPEGEVITETEVLIL